MFNVSSIVDIHALVSIIDADTEDNKILECAISAGVEFVISGDNHLLKLKIFEGIKIVTPEDFIKMWSFKDENI